MNRLVIFDFGETLVHYQGVALDWSAHFRPALGNAVATLDLEVDDAQMDLAVAILDFYNTRKNPRLFEVSEGEVLAKVAKVFNTDLADLERIFFAHFQRSATIEQGTTATLAELKRQGLQACVLTDVPYGMPKNLVLDDLVPLAAYLDGVYSSCELGCRKPHPQGLLTIMAIHSATAASTLLVGNEAKDIECAIGAGVTGVLLDPCGQQEFGQQLRLTSLAELPAIALRLPGTGH